MLARRSQRPGCDMAASGSDWPTPLGSRVEHCCWPLSARFAAQRQRQVAAGSPAKGSPACAERKQALARGAVAKRSAQSLLAVRAARITLPRSLRMPWSEEELEQREGWARCVAHPALEQVSVSVSAVPTHVRRSSPGAVFAGRTVLWSSAAAHHQAALICSGEASLALRCVASLEWSVSACGRADCAKRTPSGLEDPWVRSQVSRTRKYYSTSERASTTPRSRRAGPDKECTNMNTVQESQSGEPTPSAAPSFRSCRVLRPSWRCALQFALAGGVHLAR